MTRRRTIHRAGRPHRLLAFEQCESRLALATAAGGAIGAEGGLIGLDLVAGDTATFTAPAGLAQTITQEAFDRASPPITGGQFFFDGDGDVAADVIWHLRNRGEVRTIDFGPALDGSLPIMGPERYLAAATSGESEVLRIDVPAELSDSEGGAINLTAVLQPSGLLQQQGGAELAVAEGESPQPATPIGGASAPAATLPIESLRARAVVFRVAQAEAPSTGADALLASLAERAGDELAPAAAGGSESLDGAPLADATVARPQRQAGDGLQDVASWLAAAASALSVREIAEAPSDADVAQAEPPSEAAVDAALAAWDDDLAPASAEANAGLVFTVTRERSIVALAVAGVVGAAPVVRRFRRPGIHAPHEKSADIE
jgi:hypothetical protein